MPFLLFCQAFFDYSDRVCHVLAIDLPHVRPDQLNCVLKHLSVFASDLNVAYLEILGVPVASNCWFIAHFLSFVLAVKLDRTKLVSIFVMPKLCELS